MGCGKALVINETSGMVKIIADKKYGEVLGVAILGPHATDLINEAALAIQMEAELSFSTRKSIGPGGSQLRLVAVRFPGGPHDLGLIWKTQLEEGIVISIEKRSELFLVLSPQSGKLTVARSHLIASELMRPLADHPKTEPGAAPPSATGSRQRLAYLVTQQLGFRGSMGRWAIGNAIYSTSAEGEDNKRLYGFKGSHR